MVTGTARRGALTALIAISLVTSAACGTGGGDTASPGPPEGPTTPAPEANATGPTVPASATSDLPDVLVRDVADGSTVNLATFFRPGTPLLVWFWAPH